MSVYSRVGKVVNIIAKVNRAFTSSMEVGGLDFSIVERYFCFRKKNEMNAVILFISGGYFGDL